MGSATGYPACPRLDNADRDAKERLRDWEGLHIPQPEPRRREQAGRCMNCGVPFCQSGFGCPLHNLIPEWNGLIAAGQDREALERLLMTAPFPEFTGRVCPALCEKACDLADEGVTDRDNELYLIETGFEKGWIVPRPPLCRTGKQVAVVGSGPSGLAAADLLNRLGHSVTVMERADRPGGLLMYGIPNMKLEKSVVARRIALMEAEGIRFQLDTEAGPDNTAGFDAVVLCGGARKPRGLDIAHRDAEGLYFAVDYLTAATRGILSGTAPDVSAEGRHVVVVGGGDTGNDCVATTLRQGCASVTQLEMMPEPPYRRPEGNPWPQWPRVKRTDYGQMEAAAVTGRDPRVYGTTVKGVTVDGMNRITALETVSLDERHMPVPGSEKILPCGLMLIAAGFIGCDEGTERSFGLAADGRGRLMKDGSHHLGGRLFSAGDMRTGQSLVVRAIADGRAAAGEVDDFLRGEDI